MVLQRKYMFESKTTKMWRNIISALLVLAITFGMYSFICGIILLSARTETKNSQVTFFQSPPDIIVVFTGDTGRIEYAIKKAQEFKQPNIFISGVHNRNSVQTLLNPFDPAVKSLDNPQVELDYNAKNTVENVLYTLRYLRGSRGINKVLIISSDYHIMRIKQIFESLREENDKYLFFYSGKSTNYLSWRNIKILYREVYKLFRTKMFLVLWDGKSPVPSN